MSKPKAADNRMIRRMILRVSKPPKPGGRSLQRGSGRAREAAQPPAAGKLLGSARDAVRDYPAAVRR